MLRSDKWQMNWSQCIALKCDESQSVLIDELHRGDCEWRQDCCSTLDMDFSTFGMDDCVLQHVCYNQDSCSILDIDEWVLQHDECYNKDRCSTLGIEEAGNFLLLTRSGGCHSTEQLYILWTPVTFIDVLYKTKQNIKITKQNKIPK